MLCRDMSRPVKTMTLKPRLWKPATRVAAQWGSKPSKQILKQQIPDVVAACRYLAGLDPLTPGNARPISAHSPGLGNRMPRLLAEVGPVELAGCFPTYQCWPEANNLRQDIA